jgi:small subunit ribosomal protein S1
VDPDDDFGALLEESLRKERRLPSVGEKVRATVIQVGRESLILDLGDGQDGLMDLGELGSPDDRPEVREGDVLEAYVLRVRDRLAELGLTLARAHTGRFQLEEALQSGLPVQGVVSEVNKGGYVVEIGSTRCFCPLGAMDTRFIEDTAAFVGQKLEFRVTEMRGKRDVVLSRRALLEEERTRSAAATRERLEVGARFTGTVTNVRDFGAFVDIGGLEGLVPVSEIGYGRVRAQDVVAAGQVVDVAVLRLEEGPDGKERITLSMKALAADPFDETASRLEVGTVVAGTITRLQPFGAFVLLAPGVEGLLHVSAFGRRVAHPGDVVKPGDEIAVRVDGLDPETRRISLRFVDQAELLSDAPPADASGLRVLQKAPPVAPTPRPTPASMGVGAATTDDVPAPTVPAPHATRVGDSPEVTVDRVERYGVFVSWPAGHGLVPGRELGVPRDTDLRRHFPVGTTFRASVIEIRDDGKVTLSKTVGERADERADAEAYRQRSQVSSGPGLGTLGDLLKYKQEE